MRQLAILLAAAMIASPALAVTVVVQSVDTTSQDVLIPHREAHELGTGFPPSELITASWQYTEYSPCPQNPDNASIPNVEVKIVNMTTVSWSRLVYVADPETSLGNDDGLVNGELAFNIDNLNINRPLVAEIGGVVPLVFEPGETWLFVIQDYQNAIGLPASALGSVGLVGSLSRADTLSSGSIIAVPEPVMISLLALGTLALIRRRRA